VIKLFISAGEVSIFTTIGWTITKRETI